MRNRTPKFNRGDKVRVRPDSASPYKGCTGTVETVVKEESGFLYIVQFGKSGDLALTDNLERETLRLLVASIVIAQPAGLRGGVSHAEGDTWTAS